MRRRVIGVVLAAAALAVLACGGVFASILVGMPQNQGPRLEGPHGLVGIDDGGAYAWLIPTAHGVVLVDTGFGTGAVLAELTARGLDASAVHTIVITHGHLDHTSGLPQFPAARVITGPGEAAMLRGEVSPKGTFPRLMGSFVAGPPAPANLEEAQDGQVYDLDGELVQAIHTPGHTGGSTCWLWRGTLFTGDALFGFPDHVDTAPSVFDDDVSVARASVRKLAPLDFDHLADGHGGITANAQRLVAAFTP